MCGTTPPWEMTTSPSSLFNLSEVAMSRLCQGIWNRARTPHRYGWRAGGDEGQYAASCYHAQHCPQAPRSRRPGIRGQQPGRLYGKDITFVISHMGRARRGIQRTWSTSTNTLSVVALLQKTVDTADGKLETGLCRTRLRLASLTASLARRGLATVSDAV